jgi:hypothetical protein
LKDPLNALKIQAILAWGYMRKYRGNRIWWITATHWGDTRIYDYWRNGIQPPKHFVFHKGTAKEDARNPFAYYFWWAANWNAFRNFRKDVNIDKGWVKIYQKECSKLEADYIEAWNWVKNIIKKNKEIEQKYKEIEKQLQEIKQMKKEHKKLIEKADNEYRRIHKLMKKGKFTNIKDLFKISKSIFKSLAVDLFQDEHQKKRRKAIVFLFFTMGTILAFAITGLVFSSYHIIKGLRKRYAKTHKPFTKKV